jgi:hypothetical protein
LYILYGRMHADCWQTIDILCKVLEHPWNLVSMGTWNQTLTDIKTQLYVHNKIINVSHQKVTPTFINQWLEIIRVNWWLNLLQLKSYIKYIAWYILIIKHIINLLICYLYINSCMVLEIQYFKYYLHNLMWLF